MHPARRNVFADVVKNTVVSDTDGLASIWRRTGSLEITGHAMGTKKGDKVYMAGRRTPPISKAMEPSTNPVRRYCRSCMIRRSVIR